MGKRTKKLGDRSRSKKRGSLTGGYPGGIWQNSSTDRGTGSTRGRGREDGMKIGPDGKIPWNEES